MQQWLEGLERRGDFAFSLEYCRIVLEQFDNVMKTTKREEDRAAYAERYAVCCAWLLAHS